MWQHQESKREDASRKRLPQVGVFFGCVVNCGAAAVAATPDSGKKRGRKPKESAPEGMCFALRFLDFYMKLLADFVFLGAGFRI